MDHDYLAAGLFFAVPVFIGVWIYAALNYGLVLGVGLGWLPAYILAMIALVLWPVIVLGGVALVLLVA